MDISKEQAGEILKKLDQKYKPGKGTLIEQAKQAIKDKECTIVDGILLDNGGVEILNLLDIQNDSKKGNKNKTKIIMKENVIHDGVKYDQGKEYELENKEFEIFTAKKFI